VRGRRAAGAGPRPPRRRDRRVVGAGVRAPRGVGGEIGGTGPRAPRKLGLGWRGAGWGLRGPWGGGWGGGGGRGGVGWGDAGVGVGVALEAGLGGRRGVIVPPGESRAFLAPFPVTTLDRPDLADLLVRLGLRTLGDLAALPRADLATRFGHEGAARARPAAGPLERHRGACH